MKRSATLILGAVVVAASIPACGSDRDEGAVPVTETVPTPEELASMLVEPDDLPGDWSIMVSPDWPEASVSGVVPDELQDDLPRFEVCDEASPDARAAVEQLTWKAFRPLELAVDDPIEPPEDRSGHMVSLQEALTSDDPAVLAETYDLVSEAIEACLGEIPAGEEGPGFAEAVDVPEVGDERIGVLTTIEEAGGWAEWRIHSVLVRDGNALMLLLIGDIRAGEDVEPYYSTDDISELVEIVHAQL